MRLIFTGPHGRQSNSIRRGLALDSLVLVLVMGASGAAGQGQEKTDRSKPASAGQKTPAKALRIPAPPMAEAERAAMLKHYRELAENLSAQIEKSPDNVGLYSRRGDFHMFLGDFKESEADYAKMIALDSELFASHWRLGIAYYYTGKFAKSAKQFDAYDTYNDRDRENGIWQYMAKARVAGLVEARKTMLAYEEFDREPFPQLYAMFEGKDTTAGDGILKEIRAAKNIANNERERRLFFANMYVGIYKEMTGDNQAALDLLREAAASKWGQSATGGPTYMWQVARLHYEQLVERIRKQAGTAASANVSGDGNAVTGATPSPE